jgi:DnaK suppressor protein
MRGRDSRFGSHCTPFDGYNMNNSDLLLFKKSLIAQQQEVIDMKENSRQLTKPVDLDQSSVGRLSRMDAMQSQAMALENKRRREILLIRIEAALERIEEGEFGFCASCDEEIVPRRLELDPSNPFCVTCAEKL